MPTYALPDKLEPRMSTRRGGERTPAPAPEEKPEKASASAFTAHEDSGGALGPPEGEADHVRLALPSPQQSSDGDI